MGFPTVELSLALGQNWNAEPPTWTDISTRVKSGGVKRGRSFEFDRAETGTCNVLLKNQDRALEPEFASSPYYPNLDAGRVQARLRAVYGGTTYGLFRGVAQDFSPAWEVGPRCDVPLQVTDAWENLGEADVTATLSMGGAGSQLVTILDAIGWPSALRSLDAGITTIPGRELVAANAREECNQIAVETELGYVFVNATGSIVFHDRHRRHKTPYLTSVATFADATTGGGVLYRDLEPVFGTPRLKNRAVVTRTDGEAQTAEDAISVGLRGRRTITRAPTLSSDQEALYLAQFLVAKFKDPVMRFERIEWIYRGVDSEWATVLAREIGDRVTIKRTPPGGGAAISKDCHIESIEHSFAPGNRWRTVFSLSPASLETFLILDHATRGKIDTAANKVGY